MTCRAFLGQALGVRVQKMFYAVTAIPGEVGTGRVESVPATTVPRNNQIQSLTLWADGNPSQATDTGRPCSLGSKPNSQVKVDEFWVSNP